MKNSAFDAVEEIKELEKSSALRWRLFLIDNTFVRNYKIFSQLSPYTSVQPSTPLDGALLGLLIIRAVAMLDELIEEYIHDENLSMPKKYRANLSGRT